MSELHIFGRASASVLTCAQLESCHFVNGNAGKRTSLEGVSVVELRSSVEYRSGVVVAVVRVRVGNRHQVDRSPPCVCGCAKSKTRESANADTNRRTRRASCYIT